MVFLSNVNLDLLTGVLDKKYTLYHQEGFGQWIQTALNPSEDLKSFSPEYIFLLLDGYAIWEKNPHNIYDELADYISYIEKIVQNFPFSCVFISNIDIARKMIIPEDAVRPEIEIERFWGLEVNKLISENSNLHLFDLKGLVEENGKRNFYSDKMWYMGSIPYNMKAITAIADEIIAHIEHRRISRKKVLALDLDNTLWGGVIGEDGEEGILLSDSLTGSIFKDAQRRISELEKTGVLLVIVSKNNVDDVVHVIDNHPHMLLRKDCFVEIAANWEEKSSNISALAEKLNLGLDSFVFLDDNPVEQEAVKIALPDITVVEFPKDISKLPTVIKHIAREYFYVSEVTDEDKDKTKQYKDAALRKKTENNFESLEQYLKSLEINIRIEKMHEAQAVRVAQLTQKTNQFNLMTVRYTTEEILNYNAEPNKYIFVATVSDKFGDSGLVFVLMISTDGTDAEIDNMLMSCRVMGRYIEDTVINSVETELREKYGVEKIFARYVPTAKNSPVKMLMERLDYSLLTVYDGKCECESVSENKMYVRDLQEKGAKRKLLFGKNIIK